MMKLIDAAIQDMRFLMDHPEDGCQICKHYRPCNGKGCPHYESGVGAENADTGEAYPDFAWDCRDFNWGSCDALKDTPCNGCDFRNHWQWRGMQGKEEG